ncbi:MAG: VOC family protein, partial [Myxococcales bacterium]|nr:VOC family protein [Myxococcales bacterium]
MIEPGVHDGASLASEPRWRADAIVIGSGAGGAVAAATLAEAGLEVLVLEEGGAYGARDFTQREGEMYAKLYRAGGAQLTEGGGVNVLQGSCVGGSTVINEGDCTRIPAPVLDHWKRLAGVDGYAEGDLAARYAPLGFEPLATPERVQDKGFTVIDHLTNNVFKGTMETWSNFYKDVFGFTEVRYFDIHGVKTGLTSYALRSPCGRFCIPINEGTEAKSQINEYLEEYKGPGIQHIAFATRDILASLDAMKGSGVGFLDIDDEYYATIFERVPNVREDRARIRAHNVLVDGDEQGYLLQIFTKNVVGPIFIELIQRENNLSFGEGNFGAL